MNKKVNNLVLSATILSMALLLVCIQLPVANYLAIDFSLVAILIGRRYIGYWQSMIIMIIYPWLSTLTTIVGQTGSWVGVLFLILQGWLLITIDYILNKKGFNWIGVIVSIVIVTLWSMLLNLTFVGWAYTSLLGHTQYTWSIALQYMWVALIFNPFKLTIVYILSYLIWKGLQYALKEEEE